MTELTPLLASSEDPLERLLLESVAADEPRAEALRKTALALGLGATLLTSATAAGAGQALAGSALSPSTKITAILLMKWLAAGATAGLLASGSVHLALRANHPPAASAPAATSTGALAVEGAPASHPGASRAEPLPENANQLAPNSEQPAAAATTPRAPAAEPSERSEPPEPFKPSELSATPAAPPLVPAPGESSASFEPLPPLTRTSPPPSASSSLTEETHALDRVRQDLEARQASAALAELQRYRERWPAGALRAEAAVLRVEALLRSGDRAAAEREAAGLIRIAPKSRHAARVRELLSR